MIDMATHSSVEGDGPLAPRQLSFPETDLVNGAVLAAGPVGGRLMRLSPADLVDLAAVRRALARTGWKDALAIIEINHDCAILVRHTEARERLCIFEPAERYYYTLAWDAVTTFGAAPSTPDVLLPSGDPALLTDWGVSRGKVERLLASDQGSEGFVNGVIESLGVAEQFNALCDSK